MIDPVNDYDDYDELFWDHIHAERAERGTMTTEQMTGRDQIVYELTRTGKADLVLMAKAAPSRGDHWIIGGPDDWSKDELISYLAPARS